MWLILVANLQSISQEKGFKFVTENLTTFFTARKDICHLELAVGTFSPKLDSDLG